MSARDAVQAAVIERLRGEAALAGLAVFDAPPVRAAVPYAVVEEPVLVDWSTKSWSGFEARVAVTLWDEGERPVRPRAMLGAVEEAVAALAGPVGAGWRVVRTGFMRSRIARGAGERWLGRAEFMVRAWREDA